MHAQGSLHPCCDDASVLSTRYVQHIFTLDTRQAIIPDFFHPSPIRAYLNMYSTSPFKNARTSFLPCSHDAGPAPASAAPAAFFFLAASFANLSTQRCLSTQMMQKMQSFLLWSSSFLLPPSATQRNVSKCSWIHVSMAFCTDLPLLNLNFADLQAQYLEAGPRS